MRVRASLVTGTASDVSTITRVTVGGVDATTSNGFANWRAMVPLTSGDNTLSVETTDEFSNTDSAAAMLTVTFSGSLPADSTAIALDTSSNRALVVDHRFDAVIAVNLTAGVSAIAD